MGTNKIVYDGNTYTGSKEILDGNYHLETNLTGETLSVNTLSTTIENSKSIPTRYVPKGNSGLLTIDNKMFFVLPHHRILISDLSKYVYGKPLYYYHDEKLIGKFFISSVARVGKFSYQLSCISAIGLLDGVQHYGGIYDQIRLDKIVSEVISGTIEYRIDSSVAAITLSGWLPISTRRDNLHQILFAAGASVKNDSDGVIKISYLENANKVEIERTRVFMGGTIDYKSPATRVVVSEHTYINSPLDESIQLYNGEVVPNNIVSPKGVSLKGKLFQFREPIHDLSITGGTILESNANYAILGQSSECTLTGLKYTHSTGEISKGTDITADSENTIFVSDCTLVNPINSENIAKRVLSYYASTKLVDLKIVVENERPGMPRTLMDPFDEYVDGFIESMDGNFSGIMSAKTVFADGFTPIAPGNTFTNFVVLTGFGTFTFPEEVTIGRVACISGGTGGFSGKSGKPGEIGRFSSGSDATAGGTSYYKEYFVGKSGAGGEPGAGGQGGKVFEVNFPVTPGQTFSYSCGRAGTGSVAEDNSGKFGEDTTFGLYTSANGVSYQNGYKNILNGSLYAIPGKIGIPGGSGTGKVDNDDISVPGDPVIANGVTYYPGGQGKDYQKTNEWGKASGLSLARGGLGGGAAAGSNGPTGADGSGRVGSDGIYAYPGIGADGANATFPAMTQSILGGGGHGGHGGGGGGGHGYGGVSYTRSKDATESMTPYDVVVRSLSKGGRGSPGGDGAPGCIIVYY